MQAPLVSPSSRRISRGSVLYGRHLSIVRFCAAIALFLITLAIFFAQNGRSESAARGAVSSSEFSSGMPQP
jgi:ABC-type transport system involved in multi-copper enzyme maturation permease subunit